MARPGPPPAPLPLSRGEATAPTRSRPSAHRRRGRTSGSPFAVAALVLTAAAEGAAPAPAPNLTALLAEARRVQERDLATWRRFAFRRQVLRQRLDPDERVIARQSLDFLIEPIPGGGFDERLVAIDGRAPTGEEVREHRRAARFARHYERAREGSFGGVLGVGELDFGLLFSGLDYTYGGRQAAGGVAYHRVAIAPVGRDPGPGDDPLATATAGELGFTVDGLHLVRARTRLAWPVTWGLARVERLEIDFEGQPAGGGVWLPRRIELRSAVRGIFRVRAHNVYTYSQFEERIPGE
jgi:hypothetical protein